MGGSLRGLDALARRLAAAGPEPAYLFLGDDRQSLEEGLALLESRIPPDLAPFAAVRFRGGEDEVGDVVHAASTHPLGFDFRLVVVREPERLKGDPKGLLDYLADPNPSTCLVLVPATFDRRLKTSKATEQAATAVTFEAPGPAEVEDWVRAFLHRRGVRIEADAAALLADLVQAETLLLSSEAEKLALHAGESRLVTRADVESLLGRSRSTDIFQLTNAVEDADPPRAVRALRRLLDQGAAVPMIVAMLDWCVGRLVSTEAVKAPPARQAALRRRRDAFRGRGAAAYGRLREADRALRTTGADAEAVLERAVLEIAR